MTDPQDPNEPGKLLRPFLAVMLLLNGVVLLGQLWPEGAPPFARAVNIAFLCLSLVWLVVCWRRAGQ